MSGFDAYHVSPPIAAALERLGFRADQPRMAEIVPTAARENNLVVVTPPAAIHALTGLGGALSALARRAEPGILLILAHESALAEWERVAGRLAAAAGLPIHTARNVARASRSLATGHPRILVSTPATTLALMQRSALKAESLASILFAFPEQWLEHPALPAIMQDVGEIQRLVYTADFSRISDFIERYTRRALTVPEPQPVIGANVRTVVTAWSQRQETAEAVVNLLDPAAAVIWTQSPGPDLGPASIPGVEVVSEPGEFSGLIIAWDLPTPSELARLAQAGSVVLLVPPAALPWANRVAPSSQALRLPGPADQAGEEAAQHRATIRAALERRPLEGALLALSPLFDRHDPATVAAALYHLWLEKPQPASAPATSPVLDAATARLWMSVGKKDGATPHDFMAMLTKDVGLDRSRIGKIEVRELYSLVEVPALDAESLVGKVTGQSVKRRRITARIDRGAKPRNAPR